MIGGRKRRGIVTIVLVFAAVAILTSPRQALAFENCSLAPAELVDGQLRLALLIGVGTYLDPNISELDGPTNDVNRFRELLLSGYRFPDENICVLTDEHATHAAVEEAFQKVLLDRIASKNDVVLIYFAGHGSQTEDHNSDEADGRDETIILHDSRTEGRGDFIDDHMNEWLKRLDEKTPNITLMLDSCNSGSAARGRGEFKKRWVEPMAGGSVSVRGGDATDWTPALFSGLNVLSAATDGTVAMEQDGTGLFTQALLDILSDSPRLTYAQVAKRIPPLLRAAGTPQIAYVQGNMESFVFQNTSRKAPISWSVRSVLLGSGSNPVRVEMAGPPLPGIGPNAELRIFDGAKDGDDLFDVTKAKGLAVVEASTGFNATATVAQPSGAPPLTEGDVAVLIRPSDDYDALTFSLKPEGEAGGIPANLAETLRKEILSNKEMEGLVTLSDDGELEANLNQNGALVLSGPANDVRNVIPPATPERQAALLTGILTSHARQRIFLRLKGEGGNDFTDQETLKVQIIPETTQTTCAAGAWVQAPPNSEQFIPECYETHIRVTVDARSPYPLLVGGLVMSSDGSIIGFPSDGRLELVPPGSTHDFRARNERLVAISPYDVQDQIMVFGTQEKNPVRWGDLTLTVRRALGGTVGTLHRTLDRYLSGKRGQMSAVDGDDTTWTMTSIPIRVSQRPGGSPGGPEACKPQICEAPTQPITGLGEESRP
ncbi:Caspase domain-containing protein [Rhizobium mongolense subsp. loessense]|uniref:Caspase domain-containing protein n=1 Tax=Rhizobium mongolense subsp. loessense TaxID=158890 RepID=A0A1G4S246_9HYPH|nr:Caspase domain-containing protein [Rhizobium mongolense subsp. loessense]